MNYEGYKNETFFSQMGPLKANTIFVLIKKKLIEDQGNL